MLNKEPEKINPNNNSLGINFKNSKKIENYITNSHYKWADDVVAGPVLGDTLVVYVDNSRVKKIVQLDEQNLICLLYTSPSPRDATLSRMPSSA